LTTDNLALGKSLETGTGTGDVDPNPEPICGCRDAEGEGDTDGFLSVNGLVSAGPDSVPLGDRICCLRNAAAEIVRGPLPRLAPPPPLFNDDVELAMSGDENGGVGRGYSGGGERYMGDVGLGPSGELAPPLPTIEVVMVGVGVGIRPGALSFDTCPGRASDISDALLRFANGGLGGRIGDGGTELCGVLPKEGGCDGDDERGYGAAA